VALSYAQYAGNGSTTTFSVPFPYLLRSHVKVYIGFNILTGAFTTELVDGTTFNWTSSTQVQCTTAPTAAQTLTVIRQTPSGSRLVDWNDGSNLIAADLDTADLQNLFVVQEQQDRNDSGITQSTSAINTATSAAATATAAVASVANAYLKNGSVAMTGNVATGGFRITNVGTPVSATDGATKGYVDTFQGQTANIADAAVTTAKVADASITEAKLANGACTDAKVASGIDGAKLTAGTVDSSKLTGATVVTNAEVAGVSPNDTSFYTTSASDLRYFRQDSSETINSGMGWSGSDAFIATTAAIDARIIDLVDNVGGFVPIANETSFPAVNPDINNPDGAGTIVSIQEIVTTRTPAGGTVTIAGGSGGNVVTITGCGSTVLAAGFGVLVETTATLHNYTFHRLVPKATEVTTVAGISGNVTTVAGISANVTTVANNNANVTTVATNIADIQAVAADLAEPVSEIDTVATNIANVNTVGNNIANVNTVVANLADIQAVAADLAEAVSEIDTVATNIANVNTVGNGIANVNTVATNNANVTTVAGAIANVNTAAGSIANVNTVAGNIANVNTVAGNNANVTTVAGNNANVTTVAGISGNVTTVAGISGNVTTVATNIANVTNASNYLNAFLALYLGTNTTNPTLDALGNGVTAGDLYFNTVASQIRVYNGTDWQSFAENAFGNTFFANTAFNAVYTAAVGSNSINLGDVAITGGVFSDENSPTNRMSLALGASSFNLGGL